MFCELELAEAAMLMATGGDLSRLGCQNATVHWSQGPKGALRELELVSGAL